MFDPGVVVALRCRTEAGVLLRLGATESGDQVWPLALWSRGMSQGSWAIFHLAHSVRVLVARPGEDAGHQQTTFVKQVHRNGH